MTVRTKALLAVLAGNVIFGFSFIFSKMALTIAEPSILIACRFLVAFVALNIMALVGPRIMVNRADGSRGPLITFSLRGKPLGSVILLALFQPILYYLCESYGIVYTSSSFAGTIIAIIPVGGIAIDLFILHHHVSAKQIICALISIVGVLIATVGASDMKSSVIGVVILLCAVASASLFYLFSQKSGEHYNALEQTYVMFGLGTIVYLIFALVQCFGNYEELILNVITEPKFIMGMLYLALISSVIAFICLNYGTVRVTVSEASLFANLITVISIIAGVVFLHETFTIGQCIGAILIIISVTVISISKSDKSDHN